VQKTEIGGFENRTEENRTEEQRSEICMWVWRRNEYAENTIVSMNEVWEYEEGDGLYTHHFACSPTRCIRGERKRDWRVKF
jgi:hypothetical protein